MRDRLSCMRAAFRRLFLLDPSPEPDEDVVTPAAFRQWIAGHKHPRRLCGWMPLRREVSSDDEGLGLVMAIGN